MNHSAERPMTAHLKFDRDPEEGQGRHVAEIVKKLCRSHQN